MPDLGAYATEVLAAYAGTLAALILLVGLSVRRWRRLKAEVAQAERRAERGRDG